MKFAILVEKRWNEETVGVFQMQYGRKTIKVDKFRGLYLFGFIPLKILHIETEYHNSI